MRTFLEWLQESTGTITVGTEKLKQALHAAATKLLDSIEDRKYKVQQFNPTQFFQEIQTKLAKYPQLKNLINALQSKNQHYIWDQTQKLRNWLEPQPYRQSEDLRNLSRKIFLYLDYLDHSDGLDDNSEEQVNQSVQQAITGSQQNMLKIKALIEQAVSRIPHWNNSPIHIEALDSQNEYGIVIEPTDNAEISIGNTYLTPNFTLFQIDGKLEIDDVLEGGDTDFFENLQIQADYFNLINELRNPGKSSKGKMLTLYTARPKQDRQQFLSATTLPINIFLTSSYDDVAGMAHDFGGRDIWKARIDSRYLTQTLDGRIKHYQITVPDAPVKMELLT